MKNKFAVLLVLLFGLAPLLCLGQYGSGTGSYGSVGGGFTSSLALTNPLIASGFTNGVYPGGTMQLSTLNGTWYWNSTAKAYTNSTNFYGLAPSLAGGAALNAWVFTNALFNDTNSPNLFALGNSGGLIVATAGQVFDGTGSTVIGGQIGYSSITTSLNSYTLLQPSMSNQIKWVFPEQYGAYGNGTTNDSFALQNAINTCTGPKSIYVLYMAPSNAYYCGSNTLYLPGPITIIGSALPERTSGAPQPTIFWTNGVTTGILQSNADISGTFIHGLVLSGPGKTQTNLAIGLGCPNCGLQLAGQHVTLEEIQYYGWTTNIYATNVDGFNLNGGWYYQCSNALYLTGGLCQSCDVQRYAGFCYGDGMIFDQGAVCRLADCDIDNASGSPNVGSFRNIIARNFANITLDNQNLEQGWPNLLTDTGGRIDFRSGRALGSYVMGIATNGTSPITIRNGVAINVDSNGVCILVGGNTGGTIANSVFAEQPLTATNLTAGITNNLPAFLVTSNNNATAGTILSDLVGGVTYMRSNSAWFKLGISSASGR